jgi:hypothetical protein
MNFREKDSGIRRDRHFMILKWQIFLFPETTATIRNASYYGRGKEKRIGQGYFYF